MKTQLILILLAMCSSVFSKSSDFPSFDLLHSHCAVTVTLPGKLCVEVFNTLIFTINDFNAGGDPSHGVYLYKERQPISYVWAIHQSKYGWSSDVIFEPTQMQGDCQTRGRSRT